MNILILSDLHARTEVLDKLDDQFKKADAVLFAGDFAAAFKPNTGKDALEKLCAKHDVIFAVLGNCDNEDFLQDLEERDVCAEKTLVFHDGLAFAGAGGATLFTGKTEFERDERDILSDFDIIKLSNRELSNLKFFKFLKHFIPDKKKSVEETQDSSLWKNLILISHNPPKAKIVDAVNENLHVGSELFTKYIQENQPLAVICGHVHEGRGIEKIGETFVINPGSVGEDKTFAELEIQKEGDFWQIKNAKLCNL